jgi:hypothetical protein
MNIKGRKKGLRSAACAAVFLWSVSAALAVVRPPPASPYDDDARPPAAPEPAQILMLSSGLALVGGFVAFHAVRRRR